jgi:hypothetical protein
MQHHLPARWISGAEDSGFQYKMMPMGQRAPGLPALSDQKGCQAFSGASVQSSVDLKFALEFRYGILNISETFFSIFKKTTDFVGEMITAMVVLSLPEWRRWFGFRRRHHDNVA